MAFFKIIFYPPKGENNSPLSTLQSLCNFKEQSGFLHKLNLLANTSTSTWTHKWLEHFEGIYQVRQGNFRCYFMLYGNRMIVSYCCPKHRREADKNDLRQAKDNINDYLDGEKK